MDSTLKRCQTKQLDSDLELETVQKQKFVNGDFSNMSDDELIGHCRSCDRDRARRDVTALRNYLSQVKASEGFDVDAYPGWFVGLSSIVPYEKCLVGGLVPHYVDKPWLCTVAIAMYNLESEDKFELIDVVKLNVAMHKNYNYYVTFRARKVDDDIIKTFQAVVEVDMMPPNKGLVKRVHLCRPKSV